MKAKSQILFIRSKGIGYVLGRNLSLEILTVIAKTEIDQVALEPITIEAAIRGPGLAVVGPIRLIVCAFVWASFGDLGVKSDAGYETGGSEEEDQRLVEEKHRGDRLCERV